MIVHPFADATCYTQVHNAVFDTLMPELPPNAFKVLCLILRKTIGWGEAEKGLSYAQLFTGTGIGGPNTMSSALRALRERGIILVTLGATFDAARYRLNPAFAIDWEPSGPTIETVAPTTKTIVGSGDLPSIETVATTEIVAATTIETVVVPTIDSIDIRKKENQLEKRERETRSAVSPPGAPAPDAPAPPASQGTGPSRNTRPTSNADPNQAHPAVAVLVEERGDRRRPNAVEAELIAAAITLDTPSLTLWRDVVRKQLAAGKYRVDWMVQAWQEARAPAPRPGPSYPPPRELPPPMTPEQRRELVRLFRETAS